ncbi:uncharacterized protein LOC129232673 [Uloborus diversus]|uniref:uncharacterized protein LOC129232673 n=1 Tax=Uloborus diversus TaxID=327109 RepID=UPI00240901C2|nr:uncharacterized protein LOC129232673 [Uloborus diversus]
MPQKWIFPLLLVAALLTLSMTFDDEYDDDDEEDKALYGDEDKKNNDDEKDNGTRIRIKKRRRPIDLNIRVPFFSMFLRRKKDGPAKLGIQVFPDSQYGSLVDINHRWWWKR